MNAAYVVCTSEAVALSVAAKIFSGMLPVSHISERACMLWYNELYNDVLKQRHKPYAVHRTATGELQAVQLGKKP